MAASKFRIIGISLVFLCFIAFPLINNSFGLVKDSASLENRGMAKPPGLDVEHLDPFPIAYEKYYNDNFSIRNRMVQQFTNFKLRAYKKSPFPESVVIGYDGWLYLGGTQLNCYLGTNRFSQEQLEAYKRDLEFQQKYLAAHGCKFYFMVAPTKATIHSENIPHTYFRYNKESLGEQLCSYLKNNTSINVISLYEPFKKIKKDKQLYFKQDNHWNQQGAFYAANEVLNYMARDFTDLKPVDLADFTVTKVPKEKDQGDIIRIIGCPGFYDKDVNYQFVANDKTNPISFSHSDYAMNDGVHPSLDRRASRSAKKRKLMIMGDSFSYMLFPFMARRFSSAVNVFDLWQYKFMPDVVEQEKPDVYLLLIHEPYLQNVPDNKARLEKAGMVFQ